MDATAVETIVAHVRPGDPDPEAFLPALRRGQAVKPDRASELMDALRRLEAEQEGATVLDRQLSYALHRLAMESQVMLTEAWPGVFDRPMVATIRAVQEMVERILSGQDIRYLSDTRDSPARRHRRDRAGDRNLARAPRGRPARRRPPCARACSGPSRSRTCARRSATTSARGHAIYPQGGATALDYGGVPRRPGVAIDTRALCRVIDYPHADMTITVEAGITAAALRDGPGREEPAAADRRARRPIGRRSGASSPPTPAGRGGSASAGLATRSSASAS